MLYKTLSLLFCLGIAGVGTAVASKKYGPTSWEVVAMNDGRKAAAEAKGNTEEIDIIKERLSALEQVVSKLQPSVNTVDNSWVTPQLIAISWEAREIGNYLECIKMAREAVRLNEEMHRPSMAAKCDEDFLKMILDDFPEMENKMQKNMDSLSRLCGRLGVEQEPEPRGQDNPLYKKYREDYLKEQEQRPTGRAPASSPGPRKSVTQMRDESGLK